VLRRLIAAGEIDTTIAGRVLADLVALGVETYEHAPLLERMLALRTNLTSYDAAYVALAEGLGAALVTCDEKLARAPVTARRSRSCGRRNRSKRRPVIALLQQTNILQHFQRLT
jgi:predicted nucleic acid-binding protein